MHVHVLIILDLHRAYGTQGLIANGLSNCIMKIQQSCETVNTMHSMYTHGPMDHGPWTKVRVGVGVRHLLVS